MSKGMVVTVGTGTGPGADIVSALVKTIRDSDPDSLILLASADSLQNAEKVCKESGLNPDRFEIQTVSRPDDVRSVFQDALKALRTLKEKGFQPQDIVVDYTSGTKAMTAGVVVAGVSFRCSTLKYISGTRLHGTVVPGTEEFLSIPPASILAYGELQLSVEFVRSLRFDAAQQVLVNITDALLSEYDRKLKDNILNLVSAYRAWDLFDHKKFCGEYGKVKWDKQDLKPFKLTRPDIIVRLVEVAKAIQREEPAPDVIADLFVNAERRAREGRYDDAVARLYRLIEALGQWALLSSYKIKTGDVDLKLLTGRIPGEAVRRLENHRDVKDGKIKIPLYQSFSLLQDLEHPVGKSFWGQKELLGVLKKRNESILAHGFAPANPQDFPALREMVEKLAVAVDAGFKARCQDLQFPWL